MFCIHCGTQVPDRAKFCSKCGKPLASQELAQNSAQISAQTPTQAQAQTQPQVQTQAPTQVPTPLKLYMPSKLSFVNYRFELKDEFGNIKYTAVSGAQGFTGYRMTLHDTAGNEIVLVKQKSEVTFTAVNFEAYIHGQYVTDFMQKASFTRYYYVLPQLNLKVVGDFIGHRYQVTTEQGEVIASIEKKMMSFGDDYQIDIKDSRNELLVIATVFAVEMMVMTLRRRRR